jgi:hypothetical protein
MRWLQLWGFVLLIGIASQPARGATQIGVNTYYGNSYSELENPDTFLGLQATASYQIWSDRQWALAAATQWHYQGTGIRQKQGGRRQLLTVETQGLSVGLQLDRQLSNQHHLTLGLLSGPTRSRLRINDSTPITARIAENDDLRGWQHTVEALYQFPLRDRIVLSAGLTWHRQQLALDQGRFRYSQQEFQGDSLSLTTGQLGLQSLALPDNLTLTTVAWKMGLAVQL